MRDAHEVNIAATYASTYTRPTAGNLRGKKLYVHHIQEACRKRYGTAEFDKVLYGTQTRCNTHPVGAPTVEGAKVVCQIVSSLVKGDKVLIFHKKRRKGHRKLNGHRQQFTELTITEVVA